MSRSTHICLKYQWRCSVLRGSPQQSKYFGKCKVQRIRVSLCHLVQNLLHQCNNLQPRFQMKASLYVGWQKPHAFQNPAWKQSSDTVKALPTRTASTGRVSVMKGDPPYVTKTPATLYLGTLVCRSTEFLRLSHARWWSPCSSWLTQRQTTAGLKFWTMPKEGEKSQKATWSLSKILCHNTP